MLTGKDKYLLLMAMLVLWGSGLILTACSENSKPKPGTDGDWEAADLMDSDSDNADDGDTDTGDSPADRDESDADLSDSDGDTDDTAEENGAEEESSDTDGDSMDDEVDVEADNADMEPDSDAEIENEEETPDEPGVITVEELPWEGLTVQSCSEDMDSDASIAASRAVWGDDRSAVYFGGDHFWVLVEDGDIQTLSCDAGMIWPMYSIDGRSGDSGNELWTGHEGRIGHYINDQWSFIDLPADILTNEETGGENTVVDIDIAGDVISVLTRNRLGLYKPATNQWQVSTECPEALDRDYGLAYDGEKLWASAGVVLYTVNLQTIACQHEMTVVEDAREDQLVGITGADREGVWMTVYGNRARSAMLWDSILLLNNESHLQEYMAPEESAMSYLKTGSNVVAPGFGGIPVLGYLFESHQYHNPNCPYSPGSLSTANVSEIYAKLGASPTPGIWRELSLPEYICYICSLPEFQSCLSLQMTMQEEMRAAAWRGTSQMWHLYKKPRRYRW